MRSLIAMVLFFAAVFGVSTFGMRYRPGEWYEQMVKPSWTPPKWIFAPVWTVLYAMIAVSGWLIWRRVGFAGAGLAWTVYGAQLVLNALWPMIFFGFHRPGLALGEILSLGFMILVNVALFWRLDVSAGALLLPYLAWVAFASALNWSLWRLNS